MPSLYTGIRWRVSMKRPMDCPRCTMGLSQTRVRERQHRPGSEELFKLVAILPGQTFGQVFARVSRAAKRGVKESNTGMAATELLLPKIHLAGGVNS